MFKHNFTMPPLPDDLLDIIEKPFKRRMAMAERVSKKDYLTGPRPMKLGVITGRLRNSIKNAVKRLKAMLKGTLGTNVVYGPIHELGGLTGRNKRTRMPKKPFLEPALESIIPSLERDVERAILRDWNRK